MVGGAEMPKAGLTLEGLASGRAGKEQGVGVALSPAHRGAPVVAVTGPAPSSKDHFRGPSLITRDGHIAPSPRHPGWWAGPAGAKELCR